jgi:hypothetical protein
MAKIKNLNGKRFGRLIATNKTKRFERELRRLCYCDCGKETWLATISLTSGNTKSCGCQRSLAFGQAARNQILHGYRHGAKKRNLRWNLSDKQFDKLITDKCFFCGRAPYAIKKRIGNGNFIYNGIDRLNNDLDYTIRNVVTCCKICNFAKGSMPLVDFNAWIKDLSEAYHERQ